MPLTKTLVPIQLGGVNTKPDPKQLQAPNLLTLANGQFSKTGQINKRYGTTNLNTTIEGGGNITAGVELANFKDETILFDGNNIYTYLDATGNWANRGTAVSVTTYDKNIVRLSSATQLNPDMAFLNGIEVYAYEDSRSGVWYSVLDSNAQAFAVSTTLAYNGGQQPKVISFQNLIYIFYTDGISNIFYQTINPFNPTVITPAVTIATDGLNGTNGFAYDVNVSNGNMYVAYVSNSVASGAIQVFYLSVNLVKSNVVVINNVPGQAYNSPYHGAVSVSSDSKQNIWIAWANGIDVRCQAWNYTLTNQTNAEVVIDTVNCSVISALSLSTSQLFAYEVVNATSYNEQTRLATVSGTTIGNRITIRSVGIASKFFQFNGNVYLNTAYSSTLQATDFTFLIVKNGSILASPVIIAKETPSVGGGLQTNGMCPETVVMSSGVFKFANLTAGKILSEANTLFSLLGVNSTQLTFIPSDNFVNTVQSNTLLIVGGILQGYDGVSTTELGFNIYPENIALFATGGGSLSAGTYQYIVEWNWTDNAGQVYRSAPSVPVSITVTTGQAVAISGPTLRLTSKVTAISIVISRTEANGTLFNAVTDPLAPLLNVTTTDQWTFTDVLSDAALASNALEYTTGNVLANIAPPANSIITTYNNRVFLSGMSDPLLMWYSQSTVDNSNANTIPPQFCAELTMTTDPRGGSITALGLLNQILVIFKQTHIFAVQGNGPDATGNNNDYGDPSLVTSDVGCINSNSVVIMPQGIMFQSAKGIYLLDQSLNLTYIGAPVEAFNTFNITSSILIPNFNQVYFTTSNGTTLVYDYYTQQWSTFTNQFAQDAAIYNGNFCFVRSNGVVSVQNQNIFTDNGSPVYLSFTTPNLSFAGIQGYQRVFRCYILGTWKSPHQLSVSIAYDFNDVYTEFATINPNTNISTWGSDIDWGSGSLWGGSYQLYEYRIDFKIQKCTAIRLLISDMQTTTYGEGYAISSIIFEVGALPGGNRLPSNVTYGAK